MTFLSTSHNLSMTLTRKNSGEYKATLTSWKLAALFAPRVTSLGTDVSVVHRKKKRDEKQEPVSSAPERLSTGMHRNAEAGAVALVWVIASHKTGNEGWVSFRCNYDGNERPHEGYCYRQPLRRRMCRKVSKARSLTVAATKMGKAAWSSLNCSAMRV